MDTGGVGVGGLGANKGRRSVPVLHCASLFVINVAIILNIIVFILILSSVDEQDIEVHNMFMTILLKTHSGEKLHKCNQCIMTTMMMMAR